MNAIAVLMNFVTWLALLIMIWTVYKKQEVKPKIWKTLIVVLEAYSHFLLISQLWNSR